MTRRMNNCCSQRGRGSRVPRRPGRLAALGTALFLYAAAVAPAAGMQILDAADHAELSAEISGTAVNRITLDGDRIARVIRGPDGFAVEHDAARGDLYLRPAVPRNSSLSPSAVTLFLGTERGFTYRLTLAVTERDSAQILIRNPAARASAEAGVEGDPYPGELVALIRAVARREPLPGYAIEPAPGAEMARRGDPALLEIWRGPRFTAEVLAAPADSSADASDLASWYGPGVAAAWVSAPGKGPGGGRLAVIVRAHGRAGAER